MATSKQYFAPESSITFGSNSNTVLFTPKNVASAAGRISAQYDRGSGSKPGLYRWEAKSKYGSALTVGNALEIYLATSQDGSTIDGNQSTTDAAFSAADKRRNLQYVGSVVADSTSSGEVQVGSGTVMIYSRYISVVWWNAMGQTLTNVDADHVFTLTPYPPEMQ